MTDRAIAIEQFSQYLARRSPGRRTAIDYVSDVRQFAASCAKPWADVTRQDVDQFVDQQRSAGRSVATVRRRVAALKVFFEFLQEETGAPECNPVQFKRHAARLPQRLPRDLNNEQVEQLQAVIRDPRDRAWFVLMLRGGLRVGEVVALSRQDVLAPPVGAQPARLRVMGKGQKERTVLLSADAYQVVQEWLAVRPASAYEHVFLNEHGQPLTTNGVEWLLHGYGAACGVRVTPHQLRHTFARQLVEHGMPLASLSKLLGHSQLDTTQRYTQGVDPHVAQAYQAAMQQLDQPPPPLRPSPVDRAGLRPDETPVVTPRRPPEPEWDRWALHLPEGIRQACLAYVRRRYPTWKPRRRRTQALHTLGEFRRYWRWQLAYRAVTEPSAVCLADLQAYQEAHRAAGKAPTTINRTLDYVLGLLQELAEHGQAIDPKVQRLHPLRRPDSLPRHLADNEAEVLERFVRSRLGHPTREVRLENAVFFVLAHCGLRVSECIELRRTDVRLAEGLLFVREGKGSRDRWVYLSGTASRALQLYLGDEEPPPEAPLFRQARGQPLTETWLWGRITHLGQAAGHIAVTPHRLRHTLATRLLNAGMDITRIQKLLGHQHLSTTELYARILDKTVEADYRRAMQQLDLQEMPLATTPELAPDWPQPSETVRSAYNQICNSV